MWLINVQPYNHDALAVLLAVLRTSQLARLPGPMYGNTSL